MTEIKTASVCFSKSKSEITLLFFHVDTEMMFFFWFFAHLFVLLHPKLQNNRKYEKETVFICLGGQHHGGH